MQLVLQSLIVLSIVVQLALLQAESFDRILATPAWKFTLSYGSFFENSPGAQEFAELDGTYYMSLTKVAFLTNTTRFPRKNLLYGTFGWRDVSRAEEGRFVWSHSEFAQYWEEFVDKLASKQLY